MGVARDPAVAEDGFASRRRGRAVLGGIVGLAALIGGLVDCAPGGGAPTDRGGSPRATASAAAETSMTALRAAFPGVLDGQLAPAKRSAEVTLPATADGTVRLTDSGSGVSVGFRLVGATPSGPQRTDAHVTYPRGGPEGADLVHHLGGAGVEDFVAFWRAPDKEALFYELEIGTAAGLRLVAGSLEMLDGQGAPRLRVAPPYVVDRRGARHAASLSVEGCAVDTSPAPPWGRSPVEPGADSCRLVVRWPPNLDYPLLVDPQWQSTSNQLANARRRATATLLQPGEPSSLVVIAGGFSGTGSALTSTELYHPLSRSFASTGSLNTARGDHAAASLRNTSPTPAGSPVVVTGGRQTLGGSLVSTNVLEVFDPTTGQWTADAVSALPRAGHTATLLQDDTVLLVGGIGINGTPRNTGAIYAY
ncbi:MAG TPA: hypothetical protein ENK57_04575, partial [Polyangiaceae bacterium]|nr:hypothetical protein [Polyangiaceae bacterium]